MALGDLPAWALDMVDGEPVARLAFLDDAERPRVLPVTFALAEGRIWGAIDEKPKRAAEPARVRWLRRRPEAALCVDVYADDWSRLAWVQLLGAVELLDVEAGRAGVEALTVKYAQYRERRPPGPVLRLEVERALWWRAADHS